MRGVERTPLQAGAPPLDLTTLETRLKETKAIGVFTKITLKNQIDDLLDRFRAYYRGRIKTTLAELRQPYESLISRCWRCSRTATRNWPTRGKGTCS